MKRKFLYCNVFFFLFLGITCSDKNKDNSNAIKYEDNPVIVSTNFRSNIPIIIIDTSGQNIPDEPKIQAEIIIINNSNANARNKITDYPEYTGRIGIEIRGHSSKMFPKKNYGFETWSTNNEDINVSLLGFPKENDWILHGPFSDKTLIRNYLACTFSRDIGRYTSRCRFVELILKKDKVYYYRGLYVFMEKMKRDKKRINIKKLGENDNEEPEISGGYILKVDSFDNEYNFKTEKYSIRVLCEYPKTSKITESQKIWIKKYINDFENALNSKNFTDPITGYKKYINQDSFIDYLLIREIFKDYDTYMRSVFMYKDRNDKLNIGPVWDFNFSAGNCGLSICSDYKRWMVNGKLQFTLIYNNITVWYKKLLKDPLFKNALISRWNLIRSNMLSDTNIIKIINNAVNLLKEAQVRNFQKWNILGRFVWPNRAPYSETYDEEIDKLKTWIIKRVHWMDNNLNIL